MRVANLEMITKTMEEVMCISQSRYFLGRAGDYKESGEELERISGGVTLVFAVDDNKLN